MSLFVTNGTTVTLQNKRQEGERGGEGSTTVHPKLSVKTSDFSLPHASEAFVFVSQMRIVCKDVAAATLYDVLHDTSYRRKWDTNMIDTYDIGRLTANADVGYYSCQCNHTWR